MPTAMGSIFLASIFAIEQGRKKEKEREGGPTEKKKKKAGRRSLINFFSLTSLCGRKERGKRRTEAGGERSPLVMESAAHLFSAWAPCRKGRKGGGKRKEG